MGKRGAPAKKPADNQGKAKGAAMKILLLGFFIPLVVSIGVLTTTGYRTGFLPADRTYRHGVVTIQSCERMSWFHPFTKKCAAIVDHWDQDAVEPDDFTLTDAKGVWVISGADLHGRVAVDSLRTQVVTGTTHTWRGHQHTERKSAEVIMPSDRSDMPDWLTVVLAIGCFIVSFAIGILALRLARPRLIRKYGDPRVHRPDPR